MTLRPIHNPPNPWASTEVELLGPAPEARLDVFEEHAGSVITENDSPDVPFRYGVNPYRGCFHGCSYCYARPTHEYLGFGAGTDFERRIVAKINAPELLADELRRDRTRGAELAFSGVTDCYQPIEASYRLTRRCLEVCLRFDQPVVVITKGALVERDVDLLAELQRGPGARVFVSVPFADEAMARRIEPFAASPERRLAALRALTDAGVETGVAVAPIIPGLNDDQVGPVLTAAHAAGATRAFHILLRLPGSSREVFLDRLEETDPLRRARVEHALEEMRDGQASPSRFGDRMRGSGPRWEAVCSLFELQCRRLGLAHGRSEATMRARPRPKQRGLFDGE